MRGNLAVSLTVLKKVEGEKPFNLKVKHWLKKIITNIKKNIIKQRNFK